MANSVPYNASAGLSALMYDISGKQGMVGLTLNEIINNGKYDLKHKQELIKIIEANGLGEVKIVDTSWNPMGAYGTMNAATFKLPNGDIYVAYRGTGDGNWEYNAAAYGKEESEMQKWALDYFDKTVGNNYHNQGQLYVTGHSQGGNNAMFVTFFSEYGSLITNSISIDGPGFSKSAAEKAKSLWGESYYELQRRKSFAVYGENDYVHNQGEVHTTPAENTFFVSTPDAADIGGFHDIFTHFSFDGENAGTLNPVCEEGELSKLVTTLIDNFLKDLPDDKRYESAVILMKLIENKLNGGEDIIVPLVGEEVAYLIKTVGPVIIETALHNPGQIMAVMHELGIDTAIAKWLGDNPAVVVGLILFSPLLIPLISNIVAAVYIIDAIIHIVQGIGTIARNIKDFVINSLQAIKNIIGKISQKLRNTFNAGARYVNSNPYFKVDTDKLRSYAIRINNVNNRLRNLDRELRSLYWQVGFLDLWDIMMANLITGGSPTLMQVKSYLNNAAERFEKAENKARGNMGG